MIKYDFTEATLCIYREIVNMPQIKAPSGWSRYRLSEQVITLEWGLYFFTRTTPPYFTPNFTTILYSQMNKQNWTIIIEL